MANLTRRGAMLLAVSAVAMAAKHDDADWSRNFRTFIKQLNRYLESMNDGINGVKQWARVRQAWKELDT
jgi:hypothetical protein